MNIELFEGQSCLVHVKLPEDWEVYGGTPKGEFRAERESADSVLVTVPAMEADFTPLVPYELFARRILDGREWLVLSGQLHVRRRYSDAAGGVSPIEYFVEPQLVEDGISSSPQIIVGIPGPQGPKGEKGDPGEGGMTEAERTTLAGAAQRGAANTFSAANTFTGSVDMSTASVTPPEGWKVDAPLDWDETSVALGEGAKKGPHGNNVVIGHLAESVNGASVVLGSGACSSGYYGIAIGQYARGDRSAVSVGSSASCFASIGAVAIGNNAKALKPTALTIGSRFDETVNGQNVINYCKTEGTGSITIGAGANTLNNGDTESSNSVTIGCKALNQGADSVVIGAGASGTSAFSVSVGVLAKAKGLAVAVGHMADAVYTGTAIGAYAKSTGAGFAGGFNSSAAANSIAIGHAATATADRAIVIGKNATVSDYGATVIRSTASDGTYTQLYFSGANTPLANTYENGEAMMGYVVMQKNADGQFAPVAAGTQRLSVLFPNNSGFQPMALSLDDDMPTPKVFHPSDLDMPPKEPCEVEEYTPLPVWPIVEPSDIMGDNGTLEQGGTENTSPETNS